MDIAFIAAIVAVTGFTFGDLITAVTTRKISANRAVLVITLLKMLTYLPLLWLWRSELSSLTSIAAIWIVALGALFAVSYWALFKAFEIGNATIVGVIAGCFPVIASLVSIIFLGERPSAILLFLLLSVIAAVIWLGAASEEKLSLKFDKGTQIALLSMTGAGICFGLRKYPLNEIGTQHAWLIVQFGIALTMSVVLYIFLKKEAVASLRFSDYSKLIVLFIIIAALAISIGEGSESLALARSDTTPVAIVSGSYPALYALLSRLFFKDPVRKKQWYAIAYIAVAIIVLGVIR